MAKKGEVLLEVNDLKMYFPVFKGIFKRVAGYIKAVDGVTFFVRKGETLGLVGESGCGKSTTGRAIIRLYKPTSGEVFFDVPEEIKEKIRAYEEEGREKEAALLRERYDLAKMPDKALKPYRRKIQMIFQDPYASLNPRMTIGNAIEEVLRIHGIGDTYEERKKKVLELLTKVGIREEYVNRYPHEFSGGQRQRIVIARALAVNPELIIADEAVAALDVSIRAQVLNLMQDLQEEYGLTYIFISHDLSVVRYISDRIAVMYLGNMVEIAPANSIYDMPLHPYTRALLSAVPIPDPEIRDKKKRIILEGDVPSPLAKPSGCPFHPRCYENMGVICATKVPQLEEILPDHWVACHKVSKEKDKIRKEWEKLQREKKAREGVSEQEAGAKSSTSKSKGKRKGR